jgi:AcrR family transcriptional regulator
MKNLAFEAVLDKRKAEIVTAVLLLVDKVGITGLTIKKIAAQVGFVEGALYKHVDSKMGIFHLILDASIRSLETTGRDIEARNLSPDAALGAWFDFILDFLEEYPGIYRILFSDALYAEDRPLFDEFKGCMLGLKDRVRAIIEKGVRSGGFRSDVDPEKTSVTYLGLIITTFMLWTVIEERARGYKETAWPYFEEYMRTLRPVSAEAARG